MVYDEGLEFSFGKKNTIEFTNFFVFLRYSLNDNTTLSGVSSKYYRHCYQTLVGWFHSENNKWGCFYGHKKIYHYSLPTNGEAPEKQIVLENSIETAFFEKKSKNKKNLSLEFQNRGNLRQNHYNNYNDFNISFLQAEITLRSSSQSRTETSAETNERLQS